MDPYDASSTGPERHRSIARALDGLPQAYASVLEGIAFGEPDAELAERAGVQPAALPTFIRLAVAKLLDQVSRDPSSARAS